ncbi:hypothetical protein [Teredinibacter haidensis]|uniref:hypothetical protein n=1 Tax=Teredinibacter haidensis TaxID=2731755 RepID=UPI000948B0CF|nr:hypothetical protein [Teredinibacter haidensis]
MKKSLSVCLLVLITIANAAVGCDEQCLKEKAEVKANISFPTYLTWKHCDDTIVDFMSSSMDSLDKYRNQHFDTRYKGGMRNIKHYIVQRKEWLQECDNYLQLTGKGRIFDNKKTTNQIFASMDAVTKELDDLISGVTYSSEMGQDSSSIINERFEKLLINVDEHKTLMHLKGRYVTR